MARPAQHSQILVGHIVDHPEVFRTHEVLVGHDALDGRHDEVVVELDPEFLQVVLQVGRRGYEHQRAARACHLVDVGCKGDAARVETHAGEVRGVVPLALELFDGIGATHIPIQMVHLLEEHLGYGRCPTATAQHGYIAQIVHSLNALRADLRSVTHSTPRCLAPKAW